MTRHFTLDILVFAWVLSIFGQSTAQQTPCSQLSNGGTCVDRGQNCPPNTFEARIYSNFYGCGSVTGKCCAGDFRQPVVSEDGPQLPQSRACGLGSGLGNRILNGRVSGACDWPFVVSIRARANATNVSPLTYDGTSHSCAGVIVANRWVLTSAYCVLIAAGTAANAPSRALVVASEYLVDRIDINPATGGQQEQLINVDRVFMHPSYFYNNSRDIFYSQDNLGNINGNNIALIRLRDEINGQCNGVACLPTEAEASNYCAHYDNCIISGWGFNAEPISEGMPDLTESLPNELLVGNTRLSSRRACDFLENRLQNTTRFQGSTCMMPSGPVVTDSCPGDAGGAVLCSNGHNWVVRGILPFNLCSGGSFNLYVTDVAPYYQWIESTISSN